MTSDLYVVYSVPRGYDFYATNSGVNLHLATVHIEVAKAFVLSKNAHATKRLYDYSRVPRVTANIKANTIIETDSDHD